MARVKYSIIRANGKFEDYPDWSNVNCTNGLNMAQRDLYDPTRSGSVQSFNFVAVSSGSTTPAAGNTALTGECTATAAAGLQRASGSYTSGSAALWQVTKTFTYTGATAITLTGSALFDAITGGTMLHEAFYSATAILNTNDQIANTWSGSLS